MAHVTLPRKHLPGEIELAMRVTRGLGVEELHVYWTEAAHVPLEVPEPAAPPSRVGWLATLGALFERMGERLVEPRARVRS